MDDLAVLNPQLSPEEIMNEILGYINKEVNLIEALSFYAEKHNIEIEVLAAIVKKSSIMKAKLYEVAETMRLVTRVDRLPI